MRVILASKDAEATEWLAGVLGAGGYSVVVLVDASPSSPELRGAELLIADPEAAHSLGDAGPKLRLLLSPRGGTVDMSLIDAFADVLAVPGSPEEVLARIEHVLNK
jgi:DNA-binding response OmpR family regulator